MNMTIGAVLTAPSSQPQVKASESGFSGVLSEVRTASSGNDGVQFSYTQQKSADPSAQDVKADIPVTESDFGTAFSELMSVTESFSAEEYDVSVSKETISAEFKNTVISLVSSVTDGSEEENGRVIDALLKVLKKMQDDTEEGSAAKLLMELLAAITGVNTDTPVFELNMSSSELCVTTENTEINAILSEEKVSAAEAFVQAPVSEETAQTVVTPEKSEMPVASKEVLPEKSAQPLPENSQEKLLNDLLALAKKELGLTKATLVTENPTLAQTEQNVQTDSSFMAVFNRKDGTDELNSILNGTETEYGVSAQNVEKQEIKPVNIANDAAAVLTNAAPQQQVQAPAENPVQVEAPLPEQQIADEILSKPEVMNGGKTEFTMVLNPEHLGKITVRLVSTEGRVEVNISAENDSTRQLLESRAENIGAALRNNGVELERYQVVSEHEDAELMQQNYDGSSKNPYGRDDENESQNDDSSEDFLEILQQL